MVEPTRSTRLFSASLLLLAVVLATTPTRVDGVWGLEELYEDEILEYVQQFTGDLDNAGIVVPEKILQYESDGWYQILYDETSAGMDKGKDTVDTGLNYYNEFPSLGTKESQLYSSSLRRCGPNLERSQLRELGCTSDLPAGSPYGSQGSPGFGPQQWAYRGASLGPPDEPVADEGCDYKLSYDENLAMGYECYDLPPLGGIRTPDEANDPDNLLFSVSGKRLPPAQWRDRLEPYYQKKYDSAPLRWGFEEGTCYPYWALVSAGMPNFAVKKHCFLDAFSGTYQLCSAYPWDRRENTHGLLHVKSVPFVLGMGDLTFEANGGDATVPEMPRSTFPLASDGEGVLGVALTRISDGSRLAVKPIRARRHWETLGWTGAELEGFRGEKFTLDVYDYRAGDWGWVAVDNFVVPAAWITIESVTPIGGPRAGGTLVEIVGENFGNSADGIVVFIGEKECTSLGMTQRGSLTCITPPGEGHGVTVSVVVGDYDRTLQQGPFGGHQAGHCGDESAEYPFSACRLGEASLEAGVPKRGFTYLDAPYWISVPVTEAREDSQYRYTAAAADDDDGDELFYTADVLPSFMRFDPATQVISGTPLRGDVNCRSDQWHPAVDRCREGGFHLVRLAVSDYTFVVYQEFIVHVLPNDSPLLEADRSFHWPTLREINAVRVAAQRDAYHLRAGPALAAMALKANDATVFPWTARDPAAAAARTLLTNLLQETRVDSAESRALVAAVRASGVADEMMDLISALEAGVRAQELQVSRNRASQPSLVGGNPEGWMVQLQDFMENSARGTTVMWQPAGGGGPGASNDLISGSGHAYGGFLPTVPGPGYALTARRLNDLEMVVEIPTSCWSNADAASGSNAELLAYDAATPSNATDDSWRHPRVVSCDFGGYHATHFLYLLLDDGGLRFVDAVMEPPDIPHVDLISAALESQDLLGLVESVTRRAASYAKRWEEFQTLPARYEAVWQPTSSGLTIVASVGGVGVDDEAEGSLPEVNISVSMDVPHAWPWPAEGELRPASIRVLAADDIPYHRREAVASLSAELATDATLAGGDNQGGLANILLGLERKLAAYAFRCANDCAVGNGACDTSQFPPVCRCFPGHGNLDCSHVSCPNDCSGRGACDSQQICERDVETGEIDCVGGTGKCACEYPFFGADCSLQPCAKRYLVKEGVDVSRGEASFAAEYEANGWQVTEVRLSPTNGDAPPLGSIPGDAFSLAAAAKGVAYVVFGASDDATAARAADPFYAEATPSRGVATRAREFPEELRALEQRERHLLSLFGEAQVECTGHGACDYGAGQCYCANRYFGAACEFTYCPKDCAGHGACDFVTGQCLCETNYLPDVFDGCVLRPLYLASTTCEDAAMDARVDSAGRRVAPLYLSCMLGVALGSSAVGEHCPEANAITGDKGECYTIFPESADADAATAPDATEANAEANATTAGGLAVWRNAVCSDCSGFASRNVSQIHLYPEEPCRNVFGVREEECLETRVHSDVVPGLGMLPPPLPAPVAEDAAANGTAAPAVETPFAEITFNLTTMRRKEMRFTRFTARPGIVREFWHPVQQGGCGACTDANPMCGARFEVLRDGVLAYAAVVASEARVDIDVRNATTITLRTGGVTPTYWRLGGGLGYGGGDAPALATEPVRASFCDGAAWADAALM